MKLLLFPRFFLYKKKSSSVSHALAKLNHVDFSRYGILFLPSNC